MHLLRPELTERDVVLGGEDALELGSGAGTASLCLAARVAGCAVTGVEIDAAEAERATGPEELRQALGRLLAGLKNG